MPKTPLNGDGTPWPGRVQNFETFAAELMRRRAALGREIDIARNTGTRRTDSKRALLAAIEATGGKW